MKVKYYKTNMRDHDSNWLWFQCRCQFCNAEYTTGHRDSNVDLEIFEDIILPTMECRFCHKSTVKPLQTEPAKLQTLQYEMF